MSLSRYSKILWLCYSIVIVFVIAYIADLVWFRNLSNSIQNNNPSKNGGTITETFSGDEREHFSHEKQSKKNFTDHSNNHTKTTSTPYETQNSKSGSDKKEPVVEEISTKKQFVVMDKSSAPIESKNNQSVETFENKEEIVNVLLKQAAINKFSGKSMISLRKLAKDEEVRGLLLEKIESGEVYEKIAAIRALVIWRGDRYKYAVLDALRDDNEKVVEEALSVLRVSQMRSEEAVDALMEIAPDYKDSKNKLIGTLAAQNTPRAIPYFLKSLSEVKDKKDNSSMTRKALLIDFLGLLESEKAVKSIEPFLKDKNQLMQAAAIESVERIALKSPKKIEALSSDTIKYLLTILESDKKNLYFPVTNMFSNLTGERIILDYNSSPEMVKEVAHQWRKKLAEYLK